MKVREYLQDLPENTQVTFIKRTGDREYKTTPIKAAWEWLRHEQLCDSYLVMNAEHPPIDVTGGGWLNKYSQGSLKCALITAEGDILKLYGEKQGREMIEYYKRTVK